MAPLAAAVEALAKRARGAAYLPVFGTWRLSCLRGKNVAPHLSMGRMNGASMAQGDGETTAGRRRGVSGLR